MPAAATLSREEILDVLTTTAKTRADDFRIKVLLKARIAAYPEQVLSVRNARVEHVSDPETWIPKLIGGSGDGTFTMEISHEDAPATVMGKITDLKLAGPTRRGDGNSIRVDWSVLDDPEWTGPTMIVHPERPKVLAPASQQLLSIARGEVPRSEGGGGGNAVAPPQAYNSLSDELIAQKERLTERERRVEIAALQREGELKMEQLRGEMFRGLESVKTSITALAAVPKVAEVAAPIIPPIVTDLLAEVKALTAKLALPAVEPKPPPPSILDKIFSTPENVIAILPIIMKLFEGGRAETQTLMLKLAEMQNSSSKEMREMQAAAAKDMRDLLLSTKSNDGTNVAKFMEMMATSQAQSITQISNVLDMQIRMVREMAPEKEEEESTFKTVARMAFEFLGAKAREDARAQRDIALQLAPGRTMEQPVAEQPPAGAAPAPGTTPGTNSPERIPAPPLPESKTLQLIKRAIQEMRPTEDVASMVVQAVTNDPEFGLELKDYVPDDLPAGKTADVFDMLEVMFDEHLGEWVEADTLARLPYVTKLFKEIGRIAEERAAAAGMKIAPPVANA